MAEEVSPESKLYVNEEIEKIRKEFREDLKDAQSRATKTFTTVALIIGLLASVGVFGLAKSYVNTALSNTTIKKIEANANDLHDKIVVYEKEANDSYKKIAGYEQQVGKFASKENLEDAIKNHTHTITYSGKESGTKYIKNQDRVNIPDGHIIVGAYADGAGTIFYYKKLEIEAPK